MVATKTHTITRIAARRAKFFATLAETNDAKKARAVSGYRSKNAKSRLVKKLKEDHTLEDKHRSGRPVTITQDALDRALELLVSQETPLLTGEDLLHQLKQEGLVPAKTIRETLMTHLRTHVKSLGHQLIPNFRGTIFALLQSDAPARVQFAKELQDEIEDYGLDHIWFEDETTLEEFPHPKGKHAIPVAHIALALHSQPQLNETSTNPLQYAQLHKHAACNRCMTDSSSVVLSAEKSMCFNCTSSPRATPVANQVFCQTGQKTCLPHLHIPGMTPRPQRQHSSRAGRSLKVLGFVCLDAPVQITIWHRVHTVMGLSRSRSTEIQMTSCIQDCVLLNMSILLSAAWQAQHAGLVDR